MINRCITCFLCLLACIFSNEVFAFPKGLLVKAGTASTQIKPGPVLEITTSDDAILEWAEFSINSNETVRFIQSQPNSTTLNRVVGSKPSLIIGKLQGNGQIYSINTNGILIGNQSQVTLNGFIGSTIDISNSDFLRHRNPDFNGNSQKSLIVYGKISANNIELHSFGLEFWGTLEAPSFADQFGKIKLASGYGSVQMNGQISAPGGSIKISGTVLNLYGNTQINTSSNFNGGSILIGGNFQEIEPKIENSINVTVFSGARIHSDSILNGDGGRIVVWSDNINSYLATDTARGPLKGGNAGFIQICGEDNFYFNGITDVTAPLGHPGTVLLLPGTCP